jgi:cytochrome bd-type quinol oxidase subunit 2
VVGSLRPCTPWPSRRPVHLDAAAPPRSLWFLFFVSAVLLPVMLAYNAWQYLVFRGKAGQEDKPEH